MTFNAALFNVYEHIRREEKDNFAFSVLTLLTQVDYVHGVEYARGGECEKELNSFMSQYKLAIIFIYSKLNVAWSPGVAFFKGRKGFLLRNFV
jgi:hypothetical protein